MTVLIRFGIMAPPLRQQLREQRVRIRRGTAKAIEACEGDCLALSRLTIRGVITERVRDAGRKKVLRDIIKCCEHEPLPANPVRGTPRE